EAITGGVSTGLRMGLSRGSGSGSNVNVDTQQQLNVQQQSDLEIQVETIIKQSLPESSALSGFEQDFAIDSMFDEVSSDIMESIEIQQADERFAKQLSKQKRRQLIQNLIDSKVIPIGLMLSPGLSVGGIGFALASTFFDFNIDFLFENLEQQQGNIDEISRDSRFRQHRLNNINPELAGQLLKAVSCSNDPVSKAIENPIHEDVIDAIADVLEDSGLDELGSISDDLAAVRNMDKITEIQQGMEEAAASSRSDTISLDTSGFEELLTADPRYYVVGNLNPTSLVEGEFDLPVALTFEQADLWIKQQLSLNLDSVLRYNINGKWLTLANIQRMASKNIPIRINGKEYSIAPSTTLARVQGWLGYSLSDHIYIAIAQDGEVDAQVALSIAQAKWRYWVEKGATQITRDEFGHLSHIKQEFPYYYRFYTVWGFLFKGDFNFLQMIHDYNDIKVIDDLCRYIMNTANELLVDNLEVYRNGRFDSSMFEDIFKNSYFYKKFGLDKVKEDRKGVWVYNGIIINNDVKAIVDGIYNNVFGPGFKSPLLGAAARMQAEYLVLDIIMKVYVKIHKDPSQGGPEIRNVVERVKEVLNSPNFLNEITSFLRSDAGRVAFFDKFREVFFDDAQLSISATKLLSSVVGRTLEAEDFMDDFPDELLDILIHEKISSENFVINGMNYGAVTGTNPLSRLGLNAYIDGLFSKEGIESIIFGDAIAGVSRLVPSNRRFGDSRYILTDKTLYMGEDKNTVKDSLSIERLADLANDWASDAFMLVMIEMARMAGRNMQLKNLRSLDLTASAPSSDPAIDLSNIINAFGYYRGADRTQFYHFKSGNSLKFPALYTFIFLCAKKLSSQVTNVGDHKTDALNVLNTYINSDEFRTEMENLVALTFSKDHIDSLGDGFYDAVRQYFIDNLNLNVLLNVENTGYNVEMRGEISLLFKKLDDRGRPVKQSYKDLPDGLKYYDTRDHCWKFLKIHEIYDELDLNRAYIFVHGFDKDSDGLINGILDVTHIRNRFPEGVREGYRDLDTGIVYHNVYLTDAYGNSLYSKIELNDKQFTVREAGWHEKFTSIEGTPEMNFYIAFGLTFGRRYLTFLFDTDTKLNAKKPFEDYLPNVKYKSKAKKVSSFRAPQHVNFKVISGVTVDKLNYIMDVISQMDKVYTPYKKAAFPGREGIVPDLSLSPLVVPKGFYGASADSPYSPSGELYSLSYIHDVIELLDPTDEQLEDISWFTLDSEGNIRFNQLDSKKFYGTMLQLIQNNINDPLFCQYKEKLSQRSIDTNNLLYCTEDDFETIEIVDRILSEIFSYEGFTLLQLGMLTFARFQGQLSVQQRIFHPRIIQEITNKFGFRAGNSKDISPYENIDTHTNMVDFLISSLASGNYKVFRVVDLQGNVEARRLFTYPGAALLSNLIQNYQGNFESHTYHGQIRQHIRNNYYNKFSPMLSLSSKNVLSKQALYSIYARFIDTQITPQLLLSWAHINPAFKTDTDTWVEIIRRYVKIQYKEAIYCARSTLDPILIAKRLVMKQYVYPTIHHMDSLRLSQSGGVNGFYSQNKLAIDGNSIYKDIVNIQYALQFDYEGRNNPLDLQLIDTVFTEIDEKIIHTFSRVWDI
ncbi:MAG: hypothetical protein ACFFCI_20265, partial [Promethearchaeota archaeon]